MSTPEENQTQFMLQRLYLKDASFEAPNIPEVFLANWQPKVDLALQNNFQLLSPGVFEASISVTVTARVEEKIAFLVEIKQAGIFSLSGFPEDQEQQILAITCPNILFPYAREAVSDLVTKASFPQLLLEPVNFEALYYQQQNEAAKAAPVEATETTH